MQDNFMRKERIIDMKQECGRIRPRVGDGLTKVIDRELKNLKLDLIAIKKGETYRLETGDREYALVLISGSSDAEYGQGERFAMGPRGNPFEDMPYALFLTREQRVTLTAKEPTLIAAGNAPAAKKIKNYAVGPDQVKTGARGADNWTRDVRMILWSDNTEGNMLIAGETCTPSGNWSTVPPHRHQFDIEGEEVPYEEVYYFRFSRPQGFGLIWHFDDEMDQAYSLKTNDAVYISRGYHPVACGPGSILYQLTLMSGPRRMSRASLHPDYKFLLEDRNMANQYVPDVPGKG